MVRLNIGREARDTEGGLGVGGNLKGFLVPSKKGTCFYATYWRRVRSTLRYIRAR
jgi:hypothetical protein